VADLSLWLVPEEESYDLLSCIIARLSQQHGTPSFEPHLTLLSGITLRHNEATTRTTQLAARLEKLEVVIRGLGYRDEFFRALFLEAERTAELMNAHQIACTVFNHSPNEPFLPHVSLLYGHLPAATKERIIAQLISELKLPFSFRVRSVDLMVAASHIPLSHWRRIVSEAPGR